MKNVKRQQSWFGTKRIKRSRRKITHTESPSSNGLLARITDDGRVFTATIINGRAARDFVRIFSDDLAELSLRLRQNGVATQV